MDLCPGCSKPENDHDPKCLMLQFKKANRPSALSDGLAKLIDLQQKYIKLILEEAEETVPIAYAHGWRSTRYEEGKRIRKELAKLQEQFG